MTFVDYLMRAEFLAELFVAELLFIAGVEKKKYFVPKLLLGLIVCACIMIFVNFKFRFGMLSLIKYLSVFFISCLVLYFCWKIKWQQCAFIGICSYSMQHIGYCVDDLFFRIVRTADVSFTSWGRRLLMLAWFVIVYLVMYFIFVKKFRREKEYWTSNTKQILTAFIILLTTSVLNLLVLFYNGGFLTIQVRIALRIYAIVCCLFAIMIQQEFFYNSKLEKDKSIIEQLLLSEFKHSEMTKNNMDFINIKCHDLKKQIAGWKKITDEEAKKESITEIEKAVSFMETLVKSGNSSLDIVLMEKSMAFKQQKAQFSYIVDGALLSFMNPIDVYSLFGNALDNALEGVSKLSDVEKRIVRLRAEPKGKMYFIEIENCYDGEIVYKEGLPATQNDKKWHGYGIKSIKYIVEKYKGNVVFDAKDNMFTLRILIPLI